MNTNIITKVLDIEENAKKSIKRKETFYSNKLNQEKLKLEENNNSKIKNKKALNENEIKETKNKLENKFTKKITQINQKLDKISNMDDLIIQQTATKIIKQLSE